MGQRHVDKVWPLPKTTRHVWIRAERGRPPIQGYVLGWNRHGYRWSGLVIYVDGERIIQEWLPLERLAAVKARAIDMPGGH